MNKHVYVMELSTESLCLSLKETQRAPADGLEVYFRLHLDVCPLCLASGGYGERLGYKSKFDQEGRREREETLAAMASA